MEKQGLLIDVEKIARVCHEANRAYCQGIGDMSQMPWDAAPEWQRHSAIAGVRFALENPGAPASSQHDAWLADKEKDGWKYGAVKNAETKEHPCFVPYEQLPIQQQLKDSLFKKVVIALVREPRETIQPQIDAQRAFKAPIGQATSISDEDLKDIFDYHAWTPEQIAAGQRIRAALALGFNAIMEDAPPSADRSTALRKVREARMDANSAITHKGKY